MKPTDTERHLMRSAARLARASRPRKPWPQRLAVVCAAGLLAGLALGLLARAAGYGDPPQWQSEPSCYGECWPGDPALSH